MSASENEMLDGMMGDFLDESSQLLDRLNANMLRLDHWVRTFFDDGRAVCDAELLNEMFRSAHSIKGLSAMLGLENVNKLTHKMENVLDAARRGELRLTAAAVDVLYQSLDRLSAMIEGLREGAGDVVEYDAVIANIQHLLQADDCERPMTTQADADAFSFALPTEHEASSERIAEVTATVVCSDDCFAGIDDESDINQRYIAIFIDEAQLSLDELTETLLATETHSTREAVQCLLITAHRLKGSAACVGLHRPAKLAHLMEDALQQLYDESAALDQDIADVMLKVTDAWRKYVDGLKNNRADAASFGELANQLLRVMEMRKGSPASAPGAVATDAVAATTYQTSGDFGSNVDDDLSWQIEPRKALEAHDGGIVGRVTFVAGFPLATLKAQLLIEKLSHLGTPAYCEPNSAQLETMESVRRLTFAVGGDITEISLREQLSIAGVESLKLAVVEPMAEPPAGENAKPTMVTESHEAPMPTTPVVEAKPTRSDDGPKPPDTAKPTETLRVDIDRLDQLMNLAGELVTSKARFSRISDGLRQIGVDKTSRQALFAACDELRQMADADRGRTADDSVGHSLRRIVQRLEGVQRKVDEWAEARTQIIDLGEAVHQLERVADGIQKGVMETRMVPVGPLFTRFRRVVRDITRLNGKDIRLDINGEKTELDKRMIDELSDPLIHMVRNAADHGIESPEARLQAGKPAQGVVTLDAFHRGNSIVIEVCDDGKGLDQARIKAKAVEKRLISEADAERLTSRETFALIWHPGFSTAEKVTEISGRGMGMDIVKSKIEALNGTVELDSETGRGTTIVIRLPLTLAILPSLLARIDGAVYAMPIESVNEIVSIAPQDLTSVRGTPAVHVRGRVIAVVTLNDLFRGHVDRRHSNDRREAATLVVLGCEGRELGLVVDHLLGEEDVVIKSLAENYRNVEGISGACVLGDGRVSLILDVASLVQLSSGPRAAAKHRELAK